MYKYCYSNEGAIYAKGLLFSSILSQETKMCFLKSSQELNYPFKSKLSSKICSHCTLMADSIQVAQPIRLQHLH